MSVLARLYVSQITRLAYNPAQRTVRLNAVTRGEHNKNWASATPAASFEMTINNAAAAEVFEKAFEEGKELEVTFRVVEKD